MSDTNDVLGAAGGGEMFEARGQAWSLSHIGPAIRAKFSAWCKLRARQEVIAQKRGLDPDDYAEQVAILNEELAAGSYNWGSPFDPDALGRGVRTVLRGDDGRVQLAVLLLEKAHGQRPAAEVVALIAANPEGFALAFAAALGWGPAPNVPAPASTKPGTSGPASVPPAA